MNPAQRSVLGWVFEAGMSDARLARALRGCYGLKKFPVNASKSRKLGSKVLKFEK
jgi:hypothetical protein